MVRHCVHGNLRCVGTGMCLKELQIRFGGAFGGSARNAPGS